MRVFPKVSTGTFIDGDLPKEDTTEVETDVMLKSGQAMVLGGLIQEQISNTQSKIPWLGDIPYAGVLFQRRVVNKERKEIIVALVPYVLPYQPVMAQKQAHAIMRVREPLTHGPLHAVPRPYEATMPDTCTNPTPVVRNAMRAGFSHLSHHNTVPQPLPLIDESHWPIIDEGQVPEIQFPSGLYAPIIEE